jgi:hypothetical protein
MGRLRKLNVLAVPNPNPRLPDCGLRNMGSPANLCLYRESEKTHTKIYFFLFFCNLFYNDIILRKIRVAERVAEGLQKDGDYTIRSVRTAHL